MSTLFNVLVKRIFVITLIALSSCKDSDKNSSLIFEELNESLERSNENLQQEANIKIKDLEAKADKPETTEKATLLLSKARYVHQKSSDLFEFIDSLRKALDEQIGANSYVGDEGQRFVDKIFNKEKKASELYKRLIDSRVIFLNTDSNYKKEFERGLITVANYNFIKRYNDDKQFAKKLFANKTYSEAITSLSKFKNDILSTECNLIEFFRTIIVGEVIIYDYFPEALTSQNSMKFRAGEELIITTGIGAYSVVPKQEISINKLLIEIKDGVGIYKMKVSNKPGRYKVPIKIKYTTHDGRQDTFEKDIEYTVVE